MRVPVDLNDVSFADIVVVGRVVDYHIVRDMEFRRKMLAGPKLPRSQSERYRDPKGQLMGDYAKFDILVDEVLVGQVPECITVTWDNSTFGQPETMPTGPFLIALRRAGSPIPPLRGPSATIMPNPDPSLLAVVEAPCAGPFLFESDGKEAMSVRQLLAVRPR